MKMRNPDSPTQLPFADRTEAGRLLALELGKYRNRKDVEVLALPRGGLPVAHEIAEALNAPMDALLVRKLGVPGQEELAFGAIAAGGVQVLDNFLISELSVTPEDVRRIAEEQRRVLESRNLLYRHGRPARRVRGKIVIVVDDGIATGSTMVAGVRALRLQNPSHIVVAAPVASVDAVAILRQEADEVVCLDTPDPFYAVGYWYRDFTQVTDDEARRLMDVSAHAPAA